MQQGQVSDSFEDVPLDWKCPHSAQEEPSLGSLSVSSQGLVPWGDAFLSLGFPFPDQSEVNLRLHLTRSTDRSRSSKRALGTAGFGDTKAWGT